MVAVESVEHGRVQVAPVGGFGGGREERRRRRAAHGGADERGVAVARYHRGVVHQARPGGGTFQILPGQVNGVAAVDVREAGRERRAVVVALRAAVLLPPLLHGRRRGRDRRHPLFHHLNERSNNNS